MMVNPFLADGFSVVELTRAINILPNNYGKIRERNIAPGRGIRSRTVIVEEKNGVLTLLQSMPVGSEGQKDKTGKRNIRSLVVPHIPHDAVILPDEYDGVRVFGTEGQVAALEEIVTSKLAAMRSKHAITLEHLRAGMLKGIILDADGSTLYNLYTEFGITPTVLDFALTTETTDVAAKCRAVTRTIEDNLLGEVMSGVHCFCGSGFFDALISHANVQKVYLNWAGAAEALGKDTRSGFEFQGITFEEYRGRATNAAGTTMKFFGDDDAHFFPVGTSETFETVFSPADMMETVNTLGLELYAKIEPRKFNRGADVHTQSNPLPICYRPGVLVKGTKSS